MSVYRKYVMLGLFSGDTETLDSKVIYYIII